MSRRRSKVRNQKGFTLIEIIAVLVILGILAAVAIPRFMDLTTVAADKAAMQAPRESPCCPISSHGAFLKEALVPCNHFKPRRQHLSLTRGITH